MSFKKTGNSPVLGPSFEIDRLKEPLREAQKDPDFKVKVNPEPPVKDDKKHSS